MKPKNMEHYNSRIKPLLDKLTDVCGELDLPFVALVQLDEDRELANMPGHASYVATAYNVVDDRVHTTTIIAQTVSVIQQQMNDAPDGPEPQNPKEMN